MTAADELREAADALRFLANSTLHVVTTEPYWDSQIVPASNIDGRYSHGIENAVGGVAGEFAATFTPGVALALADWLVLFARTGFDDEAGIQVTDRSHELVLALARLINAQEATDA